MKQTNKYLDDDGTGVKPKHFLQKGMIYTSGCDQMQQVWDRYRKIEKENLGKKKKTDWIYFLPGSKFRETESHLSKRSCLQGVFINSAPIIGKYINKI